MFPHFHCLPWELRYEVYSKMEMPERLSMARTSFEAFEYMKKHKVVATVAVVYVSKKNGKHSLNLNIDSKYEEVHEFNEETTLALRNEFNSYVNCPCGWCRDQECWLFKPFVKPTTVLHFEWESIGKVLRVLDLLRVSKLKITTEPCGGLVETLAPEGSFSSSIQKIEFLLHCARKIVRPCFDLQRWESWIVFSGATAVYLVNINECGKGYIYEQLMDCVSIREAKALHLTNKSKLKLNQITQLQATDLTLILPAIGPLSRDDYCQIFKRKIVEWTHNSALAFSIGIFTEEGSQYRPLAEDIEELLGNEIPIGPEIVVYRDWDCRRPRTTGNRITLRSLTANTALIIADCWIRSISAVEPEIVCFWPSED